MALPAIDAVGLAVFAALLWGLGPVTTKMGLERGGTTVQASMVVILSTGVLAWAALLLTSAGPIFGALSVRGAGIFVIGGIVGTTLGRLSNYAGVRRVGASIGTGVMNTRPLFAVVLAVAFLGETVSVVTGTGVVLIVVGVVVLSVSRGGDIRGWRTVELAFPIAAALAYASGNVIRRYGFIQTPASVFEAVTLNETAAMLTLGTYLLVLRRDQIVEADTVAIGYFVLTGVISGVALIAFFGALSLGNVSIVDPLMGTMPLFATLFTYLFLRDIERVSKGVIVGAVLVVLGGALVSL